jgi:hypothetical protein
MKAFFHSSRSRFTLALLMLGGLGGSTGCAAEVQYITVDPRYPTPGVGANAQLAAAPQGDVVVGASSETAVYDDTDPTALTSFHSTLEPYGAWTTDATYGTVWVPHAHVVGPEFSPYVSAGHWAYDDDYVWVSDYSWGWAPFHYGRWTYISGRGWGWIPGRTYRGAWVNWRTGDDGYGYVGWAPMAPTYYWNSGVAVALYAPPPSPYIFVRTQQVFHAAPSTCVVREDVGVIASRTRVRATPEVASNRTAGQPEVGHAGSEHERAAGAGPSGYGSGHGHRGPHPQSLGLAEHQVTRVAVDHPSLAPARAIASRPSSAQPNAGSSIAGSSIGGSNIGGSSIAAANGPTLPQRSAPARSPSNFGERAPRANFGARVPPERVERPSVPQYMPPREQPSRPSPAPQAAPQTQQASPQPVRPVSQTPASQTPAPQTPAPQRVEPRPDPAPRQPVTPIAAPARPTPVPVQRPVTQPTPPPAAPPPPPRIQAPAPMAAPQAAPSPPRVVAPMAAPARRRR